MYYAAFAYTASFVIKTDIDSGFSLWFHRRFKWQINVILSPGTIIFLEFMQRDNDLTVSIYHNITVKCHLSIQWCVFHTWFYIVEIRWWLILYYQQHLSHNWLMVLSQTHSPEGMCWDQLSRIGRQQPCSLLHYEQKNSSVHHGIHGVSKPV